MSYEHNPIACYYLFLLCAEGLSSLLKFYGGNYIDRGVRVSYKSPWVSHLLFADDSLIIMSADVLNADFLTTCARFLLPKFRSNGESIKIKYIF